MKLGILILTLGAITCFPAQAQESDSSLSCGLPEVAVTLLRSSLLKGECKLVAPDLKWVTEDGQTVHRWSGGYTRADRVRSTYRFDYYDRCTGQLLWSDEKVIETDEARKFEIRNPEPLPESYADKPAMTEEEVQRALELAWRECTLFDQEP